MYRNSSKIIVLVLLALVLSGCLRFVKPGSKHTYSKQQQVVTHHRVKAGETLYSIAFAYGRDYRDLARWNRINVPYTIFPGQKLRVIPIRADRQKTAKKAVQPRTGHSKKLLSGKRKPATSGGAAKKLVWHWPSDGKVVRTFMLRDPGRRGIDIAGRKGQAVRAAAAGRVVYVGNVLRGYGNLIIIKHNDTYFSAYAHTEGVVVKDKERVKLGQHIADMGTTGTNKTKLHFEIRRNGKPVNPLRYLPKRR